MEIHQGHSPLSFTFLGPRTLPERSACSPLPGRRLLLYSSLNTQMVASSPEEKCVEDGDRRFPVGGKQMASKHVKRGGLPPAIKKRLIETKGFILYPLRRWLQEHSLKQVWRSLREGLVFGCPTHGSHQCIVGAYQCLLYV